MKKFRVIWISLIFAAGLSVIVFMNTSYIVPIIMYHAIDHNDKATKLSVNPESFTRQMEFLYKNKYNVMPLDTLVTHIKNKDKIPAKTIAITFDDGLYNNYQYAYPVLRRLNIPATMFVIVEKIGQDGYLGWKELKEMSDSGIITIGSHTVSHKWLPSLGTKQLKGELSDSKAALEERLGKKVNTLCYPIGAFDERVERETKKAGYVCAVGTNPIGRKGFEDLYAIKRIKISRTSDNLLVFWLETSGYYTWFKERKHN